MNDLIDDEAFSFGSPTPLEMYQHQCRLLEAELNEGRRELLAARQRIARLVAMADELVRERDSLRVALRLRDIG
ncbi:hypothetical protein PMM47T1_13800 [Pseudomonas sp. M47T1]|uniref:hypothetical protein n=1 Tax=Pseudomonas sp. M47T1 TaxID=1179778 RepID=UPI00026085DB|nr:hypothetical protein [Pseudomonas sp. M47T1]EIK96038.1 hypothetical protein PMM47T1_13800 [Pseudomonas sp. M47T1]